MRSDSILQQGTIALVLGGVRSGKSRSLHSSIDTAAAKLAALQSQGLEP